MRPVIAYGTSAGGFTFAAIVLLNGAVLPAVPLACAAMWLAMLPAARRDLRDEAAKEAPLRAHLLQWGWSQTSAGWKRAGGLYCDGVPLPAVEARSLEEAYARQRHDETLARLTPRRQPV